MCQASIPSISKSLAQSAEIHWILYHVIIIHSIGYGLVYRLQEWPRYAIAYDGTIAFAEKFVQRRQIWTRLRGSSLRLYASRSWFLLLVLVLLLILYWRHFLLICCLPMVTKAIYFLLFSLVKLSFEILVGKIPCRYHSCL